MKCHKYKVTCYESVLELSHEIGQFQTRVYIPEHGVFGYRNPEKIDFFSDDEEVISEAERILKGSVEKGENYIGEVELPDEAVLKVVSVGKKLNEAKKEFRIFLKSLIDIIEKTD